MLHEPYVIARMLITAASAPRRRRQAPPAAARLTFTIAPAAHTQATIIARLCSKTNQISTVSYELDHTAARPLCSHAPMYY